MRTQFTTLVRKEWHRFLRIAKKETSLVFGWIAIVLLYSITGLIQLLNPSQCLLEHGFPFVGASMLVVTFLVGIYGYFKGKANIVRLALTFNMVESFLRANNTTLACTGEIWFYSYYVCFGILIVYLIFQKTICEMIPTID